VWVGLEGWVRWEWEGVGSKERGEAEWERAG
jgi:hypothetical protein